MRVHRRWCRSGTDDAVGRGENEDHVGESSESPSVSSLEPSSADRLPVFDPALLVQTSSEFPAAPARRPLALLPTLRRIYTHEGASALFAGVVPRVVWISMGGAVFLGVYEKAKAVLRATRTERQEGRGTDWK